MFRAKGGSVETYVESNKHSGGSDNIKLLTQEHISFAVPTGDHTN